MKNEDVFFQIAPGAGVGDGELEISVGPYDGRIPRTGAFDVAGQSASDGAEVIQNGMEEFVEFDDDIYPVQKVGGIVTLTGRTNASLLKFDIRGLDWTPALPATYTADGQTIQNGQAIPQDPGSTRVFPFSIDVTIGANPRVCLRGCRVEVTTGNGHEAAGMILQSASDLPKAFPPCGPAGGDLSGEYPDPTVERAKQAANADTVDGKHAADFIPATDKGSAGGVAELDDAGKVPAGQLPSFVDDVLEYANLAALPDPGEGGKIYVTTDTNLTYRWSGTAYVEISKSLGLGETSGTAYPGNKGKQNTDDIATLKTGKLDKTGDASNTTAAFTPAANRTNITTGEKLSSLFGKIARWFADLKTVAFTGSYNDLTNKPTIPSSLPPSGAAGGDLSGTYPNPTVKQAAMTVNDSSGLHIANNYLRRTYVRPGATWSGAKWRRIYIAGNADNPGGTVQLNIATLYWNTSSQLLSLLISAGPRDVVIQQFNGCYNYPISKIRVCRKSDAPWCVDVYCSDTRNNSIYANQCGGDGYIVGSEMADPSIEGYTVTEYEIKAGDRVANKSEVDACVPKTGDSRIDGVLTVKNIVIE